jgi:hypothetical protein
MRIARALLLVPALAACGDDVDSQVSGVFPSEAFIGRSVRVEISGDQTGWSDAAVANFGEGITVQSISVASPSALFAEITIAPEAPAGLRDVTVTDGGATLTLEQSFELVSPVDFKIEGTLAQGSVAFITINNLDFANQFDAATDADGFFINTSLEGPTGTSFQINEVTSFSISAAMLIDVDAAPGAITVTSGAEDAVVSPGPELAIATRAPTALVAGTPGTGMQEVAFGTQLFEFTPGSGSVALTAVARSDSPDAAPSLIILPASGSFADGFELFPITGFFGDIVQEGLALVATDAPKFYAVYFDGSGATGYQFSVDANATTLAAVDEVGTPHGTNGTAQAVVVNQMIDNASLGAEDEIDIYRLPVTAADVGKRVRIITIGGDPLTDTLIEVLAGAETLGESSDAGFGEDFTSAPIPAGTTNIFVQVKASTFGLDPAHTTYVASITLE